MLCVHLHSATFRAGVFESYGYFDEALELAEDLDLFFRLSEAGAQMLIEPDIASLYRRHGSNMTRDTSGARRDILKVLQRSMARRRASGRSEPLDLFFTRRFSAEIRFGRSGAL